MLPQTPGSSWKRAGGWIRLLVRSSIRRVLLVLRTWPSATHPSKPNPFHEKLTCVSRPFFCQQHKAECSESESNAGFWYWVLVLSTASTAINNNDNRKRLIVTITTAIKYQPLLCFFLFLFFFSFLFFSFFFPFFFPSPPPFFFFLFFLFFSPPPPFFLKQNKHRCKLELQNKVKQKFKAYLSNSVNTAVLPNVVLFFFLLLLVIMMTIEY